MYKNCYTLGENDELRQQDQIISLLSHERHVQMTLYRMNLEIYGFSAWFDMIIIRQLLQ